MTPRFLRLLPLLFLLLGLLAPAARADDHAAAFIAAQGDFEAALRGDGAALDRSYAEFRDLAAQAPDNPLFLAYFGSADTLRARAAWMPWTKMRLAEQGLDDIDKALSHLRPEDDRHVYRGAPVSVETRLVAITTFLQVPDAFFHRFAKGKTLLDETLQLPVTATAPAALQARLQFQVAAVAREEGRRNDEIAALRRTLQLDAVGRDAPAARARLQELGS